MERVSWNLPVHQESIIAVLSGLTTQVEMDNGAVITYGGPDFIQLLTPPAYAGKASGLC